MRHTVLLLCSLLFGCASTSDIDTSKVESKCAQQCAANYSACGQNFTIFPLMQQHACVDSLKLCVQSCPAK